MNTLESMRARRANKLREDKRKAMIRANDPEPDVAAPHLHAGMRRGSRSRAKNADGSPQKHVSDQNASLTGAHNANRRWTPYERRVAADMSLTSYQVATKLGRSMYAVRAERKRQAGTQK